MQGQVNMSLHGKSLATSTGQLGRKEGVFGQKRLPLSSGHNRRSLELFKSSAAKRVKKSDLEEVGTL